MADGDGNLLVGDEVFKLDLCAFIDDLGAALVAVTVANLFEFLDDDGAEFLFAGEDLFVLGNLQTDFFELVENLVDRKLGEAVELQLEDGVDLLEGEAALFVALDFTVELDDDVFALAPGVEVFAGVGAGVGCANDPDDRVEVVESDLVALEDVLALAGFAEQEDGAALDNVDAVVDEDLNGFSESELARLAVNDSQEDHGEAFLQLSVLVKLIKHDLRLRAALEADDHAHAVAIAFIAGAVDPMSISEMTLFSTSSAMRLKSVALLT